MADPGGLSSSTQEHLRRLVYTGQKFSKSCGAQLNLMSDRGLLDKNGSKVQKHIAKHQHIDIDSKAIIAFIGESGAGKSTLLNALLDYENIVPTSGIRACTSVATEFSSRTPGMTSRFCAVVEYISCEDFEKEAEILREDLIQDDVFYESQNMVVDLSSDDEDERHTRASAFKRRRLSDGPSSTAAAVARDKMKALFPKLENNDFNEIKRKIREIYEQNEYLSQGRQIIETDNEADFVEAIHSLATSHVDDEDEDDPQLWPLMKVIKIYLDSEILNTDAILVDLPGLRDHNAARESVAQMYMAKANEVIIVSRLTRAMTDETTQALAEMGYTKQLQYDGRKRVTIVCTFCDLFQPEDAKEEFRKRPGFLKQYEELMKDVKSAPSKRELMKLSDAQQLGFRRKITRAQESLQNLCLTTRDAYVPSRLKKVYSKLLMMGSSDDISINTFLVASKEYQRQISFLGENISSGYGMTLEQTQIPRLREYTIGIPIEQKIFKTKFFIHNLSRAFNAANFLVQNAGATMSQYMRDGISKDMEGAIKAMKRVLTDIESACAKKIRFHIEVLVKSIEKLASESKVHCKQIQQKIRKTTIFNTYRATCRRMGEWGSDPKKNFNKKFLLHMDEGLEGTWRDAMEQLQAALRDYASRLTHEVSQFQNRWLASMDEYCCSDNDMKIASTKMIIGTLEAMRAGTGKHLIDQTQKVNLRQREINREFRSTKKIKESMEDTYRDASQECGPGAYDRMIETVSEGLEATPAFENIRKVVSEALKSLQKDLCDENEKWCTEIMEEIETNIKNWLTLSDKVAEREIEEKAKLKDIVKDFDGTMQYLVEQANKLKLKG